MSFQITNNYLDILNPNLNEFHFKTGLTGFACILISKLNLVNPNRHQMGLNIVSPKIQTQINFQPNLNSRRNSHLIRRNLK